MFTEKDLQLFAQKGIDKELVEGQIQRFKQGFPYAQLASAATVGHGVLRFDALRVSDYVNYYDHNAPNYNFVKFVPASGAASRMFKDLFEFRDIAAELKVKGENIDIAQYKQANQFFEQLSDFAFYPNLMEALKKDGYQLQSLVEQQEYALILDYFLEEKGLNYANRPKALLLFHRYKEGNRLAMEEHLVEGANYMQSKDGEVKIHFTVSPEHRAIFEQELNKVLPKYVKQFGVSYEISFSEQKGSTDTIAVDLDNNPFREADGSLLFRPAGHGALIENLNDLDAQIVFIKNIDNVVPDALRQPTIKYKKVIGAHLLKLQKQAFEYLELLDRAAFTEEDLEEIIVFAEQEMMIKFSTEFASSANIEKVDYLYNKLNRPIRVCGMVKNEGEPGGGPFWVLSNGEESLQIVESSQIDMNNQQQAQILSEATHFNPVDLVCSLQDYKGQTFDLRDFVDENTGFISLKTKNGKELKAQELPGLWNGAMANWNTIFVEVPIETFNPVKTVNDLLRLQHSST